MNATHLATHNCASCGVEYGLTDEFEARRREDGKTFYCPNGHSLHYGESAVKRAERERDEALNDKRHYMTLASERYDQAETARRQAAARKGVATRMRNRAAAGLCQFCTEHFPDVQAHVAASHPDAMDSAQG